MPSSCLPDDGQAHRLLPGWGDQAHSFPIFVSLAAKPTCSTSFSWFLLRLRPRVWWSMYCDAQMMCYVIRKSCPSDELCRTLLYQIDTLKHLWWPIDVPIETGVLRQNIVMVKWRVRWPKQIAVSTRIIVRNFVFKLFFFSDNAERCHCCLDWLLRSLCHRCAL